ncbi:MAG: hydantoinase/oxoprolinase family protein [Gemmatimonadaceae bacterium]
MPAAGVDVGGTFTDLVAIDEQGRVSTVKVLSTPHDHAVAVEQTLAAHRGAADRDRQAAAAAVASTGAPDDRRGGFSRVVHGTTIATNALLERSGARVVFCGTAGATDILELRRQERASLYDPGRQHPPPLVPAERTIAVAERGSPRGAVLPLTGTSARQAAAAAARLAPETVAVCLLHAHAEPRHEQMIAEALREALPDIEIVLSSDVLPEIREYERAATTVAEAYLRPTVSLYLRRLAARLADSGYPVPAVMTSSGGVRAAADAAGHAASLALSGPAGGVVGAAAAARAAGIERALTIDMGGTSADIGLLLDGEPLVEQGGSVAGVPIALPRVLVETVSAGGGSIAWVDSGGALRVGPRSAGAVPGPVAFARGGTEPTVTDAHIVLGNIAADDRATARADSTAAYSGGIHLDAALARGAIGNLARRLGASAAATAAAIVATADAAMARALRIVSVERGVDPRGCVLVAFGGGGPLHACGLASTIGVTRVLVPPHAGVLSALGLAITAERCESMASVMRDARSLDGVAIGELASRLAALAAEQGRGCGADAASPARAAARLQWWAHMRYAGQGHELDVPFAPGDAGSDIAARFESEHRARFGFVLERVVEIVSARHAASGEPVPVSLQRRGATNWDSALRVDDGAALDATVRGRATIRLPDATLLVADGWRARAHETGGWVLEQAR